MAALGKQPTPCLCLALLFALLHSVTFGFAACSNLHKVWCVDNNSRHLAGPAPPARQRWADWQAYPLYERRSLPHAASGRKALENDGTCLWCSKQSHSLPFARQCCCFGLALKSCASCGNNRTCASRRRGCTDTLTGATHWCTPSSH